MPGSSKRPGGLRNISTSDPRANWGRRVSNLVDTTTVLDRWGSVCIKPMHLSVANIVCVNRHMNSKQALAFEHVVCHFLSVQQAMSWLIYVIYIPLENLQSKCSEGRLCNVCLNMMPRATTFAVVAAGTGNKPVGTSSTPVAAQLAVCTLY